MSLSPEKVLLLKSKAKEIRSLIVHMLIKAGSGHLAGSLGMADVFAYLYFQALKHDPKKPAWPYRDRLVLSNGHIAPVLYATMALAGYFQLNELDKLRRFGSMLQGHPHREFLPALETSSGPLGSGLSQAVGMALANRLNSGSLSGLRFYALLSDGELDEGNTWEAVMLGSKEKLHNLIAIVDRNNIQLSGPTKEIMPLEPLVEKWKAFGWNTIETDGHDFESLDRAMKEAWNCHDRPTVIIAKTIPSKGIPAFEGRYEWHGKVPTSPQEIETARKAVGLTD